jgi:outer membrane protein OmpA-like peptidoglycan-associated protein/tetratricopeptide (TPR) repeat protein
MKTRTLFLALLPALLLSGCTLLHKMQGNLEYEHMAYSKATPHYSKFLAKRQDHEILRRMADCYYQMNQPAMAEAYCNKLVASGFSTPTDHLMLANSLKQLHKYEQAREWYSRYLLANPGDQVAQNSLASIDSIPSFKRDSFLVEVKKLKGPINNEVSNYSPSPYQGGIVFVSERSAEPHPKIAEWTGQPYTDLYYAEMQGDSVKVSPHKLEGKIDGLYHEGPVAFSPDGGKAYFTRNNYVRRHRDRSDEYVNNLKVFEATLTEEGWEDLRELPFNSDEFSCGHPALSADGTTLYFVSDMPGGFGGTDLYTSRLSGGQWKSPVNMGSAVNTAGNEMFPWISADGSLYFASDGWPGMGGLDLFHWAMGAQRPRNLGYPLNSSRDDFGYMLAADGKSGFLSSNRDRRQGVDDIFHFNRVEQKFMLEGIVVLKGTNIPIHTSLVELRNTSGVAVSSFLTGADGSFSFPLQPEMAYSIHAGKERYFGESDSLNTFGVRRTQTFFVKLELDTLVIGKPIVLNNIYYDFDKWDIRADAEPDLNHLVKVMKDNPEIRVELGSHTDCRGSDKYNQKLSQKRAQSAVDYIIAHGVEASRIYAKGYGESVLVNGCRDGAKCSEEEHQMNRRTEFKVVKVVGE